MLFVISFFLECSLFLYLDFLPGHQNVFPSAPSTHLLGLLLLLHLPEFPLLVKLLYPLSFLFTQISPLCPLLCCLLLLGSLFSGGILALSDLEVFLEVEIDCLSGVDEFTRDLFVSLCNVKSGELTSGFKGFGLSMRSTMLSAT